LQAKQAKEQFPIAFMDQLERLFLLNAYAVGSKVFAVRLVFLRVM
jgi:hypothetical protein